MKKRLTTLGLFVFILMNAFNCNFAFSEETFDITILMGYEERMGMDRDYFFIDDATISLNYEMNAEGEYEFDQLVPGLYKYIIRKEGKPSISGLLSIPEDLRLATESLPDRIITNLGLDIEGYVFIPLLNNFTYMGVPDTYYDVTFNITDNEGNMVEDATIMINGVAHASGEVNLLPDIYEYTVIKEGYTPVTDKMIVVDDNEIVNITLSTANTYSVTFDIKNKNGNSIGDATLSVGGETLPAGIYSIDLPNGTHNYVITKELFKTATGSVRIANKDKEVSIVLQEIITDGSKGEFVYSEPGFYVQGISSNGKYVTGYKTQGGLAAIWTEEDGIVLLAEETSKGIAVSNNGIIAGSHWDYNYMVEFSDGAIPLEVASYYKDGEWHSFGLREGVPYHDDLTLGGYADAISADGTMIAGSMYNAQKNLEPILWINAQPETLPVEGNALGRAVAISDDGAIIGGWANLGSTTGRNPVLWIDGEFTAISHNGTLLNGQVTAISANGKYAAISPNGLYDIEKGIFIDFGSSIGKVTPLGVSDNGIVVGCTGMIDVSAVIYIEKVGVMHLSDYLSQLEIEVPTNFMFHSAQAISADGSRITGFGYETVHNTMWVVDIFEQLNGYASPKNLSANDVGQGSVNLTWEQPDEDTGSTLEGYNIYRNGVKINETLINNLSYNDENLVNGTYYYQISAVWNGSTESRLTDKVKINMATLQLPFYDGFDTRSLDACFWNPQHAVLSLWTTVEFGLLPPGMLLSLPGGGFYSEYIVSPYLDATNADELYLSFTISHALSFNTQKHVLTLEVFDGSDWQMIDSYHPEVYDNPFLMKKYNISQWAGGKVIRIRFTGSGESINEESGWLIDNIRVYEPEDEIITEKPVNLIATRLNNGHVSLSWAAPNETANLSYFEVDALDDNIIGIGNEGVPFIAANLFDTNDLKSFEGYFLKSITSFLISAENVELATYKLVAFSGEEQVLNYPIQSYIPNAWNTFELETPLALDITKPFYYGIEVVTHNENSLAIGMTPKEEMDGKSNLYSENGGRTWHTLKQAGTRNSIALRASISKGDEINSPFGMLGYLIYRDGVAIKGNEDMAGRNVYLDTQAPQEKDVCYQVSAYYYITQSESEKEEACIEYSGIENISGEHSVYAYPNPVKHTLTILGEFTKAYLYDINGNLLKEINNKDINMGNYTQGVYLLKIEMEDNVINQKIIKK